MDKLYAKKEGEKYNVLYSRYNTTIEFPGAINTIFNFVDE